MLWSDKDFSQRPQNVFREPVKSFIRLQHVKIFETVQKSNSKIVSKEAAE